MRRVDDGAIGLVQEISGELRITYPQMGETLIAPKKEVWEPVLLPKMRLRAEEMRLVAWAADSKLRALTNHTPDKFWEAPPAQAFDQGLFDLIVEYLGR